MGQRDIHRPLNLTEIKYSNNQILILLMPQNQCDQNQLQETSKTFRVNLCPYVKYPSKWIKGNENCTK
jgi:hypothetical protein